MPAIQLFPDRAYRLPDGHLLPIDGLSVTAQDSAHQVQRAIFGFRFPYLPDFLADHTLIGETDPERLAELLERQDQFITNLWKWQGAGFSLRFSYQPQRAAVEVAFLARILAPVGIAQEAAEQLASDLRRLTQTFGLTPADIADAVELAAWRMPLSTPYVVEVRQREDVVGFAWANRDAYVVIRSGSRTAPSCNPSRHCCARALRVSSTCTWSPHGWRRRKLRHWPRRPRPLRP